jgi:hypothetical protein
MPKFEVTWAESTTTWFSKVVEVDDKVAKDPNRNRLIYEEARNNATTEDVTDSNADYDELLTLEEVKEV